MLAWAMPSMSRLTKGQFYIHTSQRSENHSTLNIHKLNLMDKYLIVGLGNPGDEYAGTRHNTGFMVLDAFAKASNIVFEDKRYGFVAETSLKGRKVFLLKPTTYMNLSGNAVRYWLNKENIEQSRLLVISDDVAIPVGQFRLKANGSNGGHNGLGHIQQLIGQQYARLRMGIGND